MSTSQSKYTVLKTTLRPATLSDADLCFSLHALAMRPLISQIWGWDEGTQRSYFARSWDPESTQIVLVDGLPRGVLVLKECDADETWIGVGQKGTIYLSRIELDPAVQGQGVGTELIEGVKQRAKERGMKVSLEVWAINSQARALYDRLEFQVAREEGGKVYMSWEP